MPRYPTVSSRPYHPTFSYQIGRLSAQKGTSQGLGVSYQCMIRSFTRPPTFSYQTISEENELRTTGGHPDGARRVAQIVEPKSTLLKLSGSTNSSTLSATQNSLKNVTKRVQLPSTWVEPEREDKPENLSFDSGTWKKVKDANARTNLRICHDRADIDGDELS